MDNNNIEIININEFGASLGTRDVGETIRQKASNFISNKKKIVFSFKGIEIISSAFADELFGKLFAELGETLFRENVKLNGFDDEKSKEIILSIIARGISFRKKQ